MLYSTKGIVLRSVKYAETSIIVSVFTALFGVQSYLVNGVRSNSKSAQGKAGMYQPGTLLDMTVYHNELKNLQRIKEARWSYLYKEIFFNAKKNGVCLFVVELLQKCLRQPEAFPELFNFSEDIFLELDNASERVTANLPLFMLVHLCSFLGHRITDNYSNEFCYLDLKEGLFCKEPPFYGQYLENPLSHVAAELLRTQQPAELEDLCMNRDDRRRLLQAMLDFYSLHLPDFGLMRSVDVLRDVME